MTCWVYRTSFDLCVLAVATLVQAIDLCGDPQGNCTEPVYRALWQDGCCWWCDVEFPPKILLKEVLKSRMNFHHTVVAMHSWTISNQCTARFENIVDDGGMRIYFLPMFNKGSTGSKMNVHHTFRMTLKVCVCCMQFAVPDKVIWITLVPSLFDANQIWIRNWEAAAREPNAARVTISYPWHQIFPYLC